MKTFSIEVKYPIIERFEIQAESVEDAEEQLMEDFENEYAGRGETMYTEVEDAEVVRSAEV